MGEAFEESARVGTDVAKALGRVGPAAKEAIPELERLAAGDPDEDVRCIARDALKKIRGGPFGR